MSTQRSTGPLIPHTAIQRIDEVLRNGRAGMDHRRPLSAVDVTLLRLANQQELKPTGKPVTAPMWLVPIWVLSSIIVCYFWDRAGTPGLNLDTNFSPIFYLPAIPVVIAGFRLMRSGQVSDLLLGLSAPMAAISLFTLIGISLNWGQPGAPAWFFGLVIICMIATAAGLWLYVQLIRRRRQRKNERMRAETEELLKTNQEAIDYLTQSLPLLPKWWGTPGSTLSSADELVEDKVDTGKRGERLTAQALGAFILDNPSVFAFHSVPWPGVADADIDHVLVLNSTILLVDTKRWKSNSTYYFDGSQTVLRNGDEFPGGTVRLAMQVQAVKDALKATGVPAHGVFVRGLLVIQASNIRVNTTGQEGFAVCSSETLADELSRYTSGNRGIDPFALLNSMQLFLGNSRPWPLDDVETFCST